MMTEQQSQQLQPFNIKEYQDYLEGDDYRNYQIARLKELHRESKIISLEKINIRWNNIRSSCFSFSLSQKKVFVLYLYH